MRLSAKLPHDDEGATLMRFENIRGQRYTEIFLIGGHAITHHLAAGVYNTIGSAQCARGGLYTVVDSLLAETHAGTDRLPGAAQIPR